MQPSDILADGLDYLCYVGMETDLIFNQGVDLPEFATFPLLKSAEGRALLWSYVEAQINMAHRFKMGAVIEAPTWIANADRAAPLGVTPDEIAAINADAVAFLEPARSNGAGVPVFLSVNVGPRDDAYAPSDQMDVETARAYHETQVRAAAEAGADGVSAFTIAYANEAAGIVLAARCCGIAAIVSFTVETDGRLPSGQPLGEAIAEVDRVSDDYATYFMVNCAHPDHFEDALDGTGFGGRLAGLVVNASRCSHAELDAAEKLDDGDPVELGVLMGELATRYPDIRVFGGCCGTDQRHMTEIATKISEARGRV